MWARSAVCGRLSASRRKSLEVMGDSVGERRITTQMKCMRNGKVIEIEIWQLKVKRKGKMRSDPRIEIVLVADCCGRGGGRRRLGRLKSVPDDGMALEEVDRVLSGNGGSGSGSGFDGRGSIEAQP